MKLQNIGTSLSLSNYNIVILTQKFNVRPQKKWASAHFITERQAPCHSILKVMGSEYHTLTGLPLSRPGSKRRKPDKA